MTAGKKERGPKFGMKATFLVFEIVGYAVVIAIIWLDEIFDLPSFVFQGPSTPFNWRESLFESAIVLVMAVISIWFTVRYINRIRYLEGFLLVCSFCKRVRVGENEWVPIEQYVTEHSDAVFSHGLCPECMEKHYGQYLKDEKAAKKPRQA